VSKYGRGNPKKSCLGKRGGTIYLSGEKDGRVQDGYFTEAGWLEIFKVATSSKLGYEKKRATKKRVPLAKEEHIRAHACSGVIERCWHGILRHLEYGIGNRR